MCAVFLCVVSVVSVCLALACVACQCGFVMRRERATLCAGYFCKSGVIPRCLSVCCNYGMSVCHFICVVFAG